MPPSSFLRLARRAASGSPADSRPAPVMEARRANAPNTAQALAARPSHLCAFFGTGRPSRMTGTARPAATAPPQKRFASEPLRQRLGELARRRQEAGQREHLDDARRPLHFRQGLARRAVRAVGRGCQGQAHRRRAATRRPRR